MDYDKISFTKDFPVLDVSKHKEDAKEQWLTCFEPVPIEFLNKVDMALTEIESYIKRTHRGKFTFENVTADQSLKCLSISTKGGKQLLWAIREKQNEKCFYIFCKTLYTIECKQDPPHMLI